MLTGKIFDIQGFSVNDGPGIRLTVFMKGCPLRCLWCHSPESQGFQTQLNWMEVKCIGTDKCGLCISACPKGLISPGETIVRPGTKESVRLVNVDIDRCDNCGKCTEACKSKALYMCGTEYTVDDVMKFVRRDMPFFKKSGGGVTFSGGECTCQPEFLLAMLQACKAEDVHTAIDTCGHVSWDILEKILPYSDLFLYDLKCMDSDLHKQVTGYPNELILENAQKLAAAGAKLQIRIPTIPQVNDSEESIDAFGKFIVSLGDAVETVQLLPYHNLGVVKWKRLMKNSPLLKAVPPKDELMQARKKRLEEMGLKVMIH